MEIAHYKSNEFYVDSHCHLMDYSDEKLLPLLKRCEEKGVKLLYTNSTENKNFDKNLEISEKYTNIKILPGIGFHPWYLDYPIENPDTWMLEFCEKVAQLEKENKPFFIGEIGIDGGKVKKKFPLIQQIEIFKQQLKLANEKNLLVHIHCVYEWDKLFKVMSEMKLDNLIKGEKIILHSFQGKKKHVTKFSTLNAYFSISSGCYSKSNFEMIEFLPLDKILVESDSPSMFNRDVFDKEEDYSDFYDKENKENSPESVIFILKRIAELKNLSFEVVKKSIFENSMKIYSNFKTN